MGSRMPCWLIGGLFVAIVACSSRYGSADEPPAAHVYRTIGERKLQIVMNYPPSWSAGDRRTGIVFFSGSHKVQPDANGQLPPLASERAARNMPVINRGPGGDHHKPLCDALAALGHVCMRVEYRTRGKDGVLPGEDIVDAISAVRWVREHAESVGVDPQRIVSAGGSSGAYLAASVFVFESDYPKADLPRVSARPNAILLYSPLVDWLDVGSMTENFRVVLGGDLELGARISPARHWRRDCPPTLIMVGTEEPPFAVVKRFAETWQAAGSRIELHIAEGAEHGFFGKKPSLAKTVATTQRFLVSNQLAVFDGTLDETQRLDEADAQRPRSGRQDAPSESPAQSQFSNEADARGSTDERLQAMLKRFPVADADGDGTLTMVEALLFRNKKKGPTSPPEPSSPPEESGPSAASMPHSQQWDLNKDGKLSRGEFRAPSQLFTNLDTDGDELLTGAELAKLDRKLNLNATSEAVWVVPPAATFHGVSHRTYRSEAMRTDVGYNVYLPDGYAESNERYPVIYHLHGSGGNESSQIDLSVVFHRAIQDKKLPPVIVVFVNGGRRSYYCDSSDERVLAETTIIRELIPHIDATYRTIPDRSARVIEGFSMGGFGALKLGFKHPQFFSVCLSFSGGIPSVDSIHREFLTRILGDDDEVLRNNDPAELAARHSGELADMKIWLFVGSRDVVLDDGHNAHNVLRSLDIDHRFEISRDTGHALKRHFDLFGDSIFEMLSQQFAK